MLIVAVVSEGLGLIAGTVLILRQKTKISQRLERLETLTSADIDRVLTWLASFSKKSEVALRREASILLSELKRA